MIRAPLLASAVAEKLPAIDLPWEVYAERARRFEIQLRGAQVEGTRGPLRLEGYGVRVLQGVEGQTGVGFQASTDFTEGGVRGVFEAARAAAKLNRFPAPHPDLPGKTGAVTTNPAILDDALWSDPTKALADEAASLLAAADALRLPPPTFATLRATLVETSIANCRGLTASYAHTVVEREIAVKSEGGPEGRPPGEFWVEQIGRRTGLDRLEEQVQSWHRYAADARRAATTPTGEFTVVLPPEMLSGILPSVLGFQFNAAAVLRGLSIPPGTVVGPESLEVMDHGSLDWAVGSSPVDDEGTPQRVRRLISQGRASETVNDILHADAVGGTPTGNAVRAFGSGVEIEYWQKFTRGPIPSTTTVVLAPGDGGSDEELVETVDDGIWVQQIGWANPDRVSGTFGGEVRIGYRIRRGKIAEPVRGGTVGGPVLTRDGRPSMLNGILATGSVPRPSRDLISPSLVVKNLIVSGEEPTTQGSSSG